MAYDSLKVTLQAMLDAKTAEENANKENAKTAAGNTCTLN